MRACVEVATLIHGLVVPRLEHQPRPHFKSREPRLRIVTHSPKRRSLQLRYEFLKVRSVDRFGTDGVFELFDIGGGATDIHPGIVPDGVGNGTVTDA